MNGDGGEGVASGKRLDAGFSSARWDGEDSRRGEEARGGEIEVVRKA